MPKVSIIMPVLNGMPYFEDALKSVTSQTLKDIEMIVVDAGSSDGTLTFVKDMMQADRRIRLINSVIKSFGYQQNLGIEAAKGKYIGFCESDDYLSEDMMATLYEAAETYNYPDCVKMDYELFFKSVNEEYRLPVRILNDNSDSYNTVVRGVLSDSIFCTDISYWCGIYRNDFIKTNDIRLNESSGAAFQDLGFLMQLHLCSRTSVYLNRVGYHYRRDNPEASSHAIQKGKYCAQEMIYFARMIFDCSFPNIYALQSAFKREFGDFVSAYSENLSDGVTKEYDELIREMRNIISNLVTKLPWRIELNIPHLREFIEDFTLFCRIIEYEYINERNNRILFHREVKKYQTVVIFGKGELGISVNVNLRVCGYKGKIVYCDNNEQKIRDNNDVYSVKDAVEKFNKCCFVITNKRFEFSMKKQLCEMGVDVARIITCSGITPFNSNVLY